MVLFDLPVSLIHLMFDHEQTPMLVTAMAIPGITNNNGLTIFFSNLSSILNDLVSVFLPNIG